MKGSHRKCEEAPKKYDENRCASSSFGMLNGVKGAYRKGILKARPLKRFKGGTAILCGDKGMDAPHLVRFCGALGGGCTFRDYFVAALLVPLLRNGANRYPRARRTLLAECVHFQGLLRRCAPRAAASGGANRHPRMAVLSHLFCHSDVVLPLKAQPKKKRNAEAFLFFLVHFQGLEPWAH